MPAISIASPFEYFTNASGLALESGYIYVGTAGLPAESNPIPTYTNVGLTTTIAQPIRTSAGYAVSSGTPITIYVDATDYSITIRDKNGTLVFQTLNASLLTAGSITTAKLADGAVTTPKITDLAVTTIKIADANVTLAKIANVGSGVVLGRSTAGSGVLEELTTLPAVNGSNLTNLNGANIATGDIAAARITTALNASGSAPLYACRAWVNFNGTGTVAIRAAGNVSSITDNGVGDYTVNFTTAMPTANYAAIATTGDQGPIIYNAVSATAQTVNLVRFRCFTTVAALVDTTQNHVAIFC